MRRLEADVFPAFGHKFIDGVTAADLRELMLAIERRDARDVAKRSHETTSQVFRFAIARDIASRNPAADFKPRDILAEARTENRARVSARELPELLAKMDDYNGDAITRFAMKLMAYTFVRTSEEIEAPWTELESPMRRSGSAGRVPAFWRGLFRRRATRHRFRVRRNRVRPAKLHSCRYRHRSQAQEPAPHGPK